MVNLKSKIRAKYYLVINSIAFMPALVTIGLSITALLLINFETIEIRTWLSENAESIILKDKDTARSILGVFIGGLISLTVFSFSMVMILLNQASNNYSPRLLPGLISSKRHQIVLGTYLGTIGFCILVLINIQPNNNSYDLPMLGFMTALVLMAICLSQFIFFINNISKSIQISNILVELYRKTSKHLSERKYTEKEIIEESKGDPATESNKNQNGHLIQAHRSGYFREATIDDMLKIAAEENLKIRILIAEGKFVLQDQVMLSIDKPISESIKDELLGTLNFSIEEIVDENYFFGFKHFTEIATKAMSPGINDPGTALNAIDYLSELYMELSSLMGILNHKDEDEVYRIFVETHSFEQILSDNMTHLRVYCKGDPIVAKRLLSMLHFLKDLKGLSSQRHSHIKQEIELMQNDMKLAIENKIDYSRSIKV